MVTQEFMPTSEMNLKIKGFFYIHFFNCTIAVSVNPTLHNHCGELVKKLA